jgi:iron complex outermembrane receptor protein
VQTLREPEIETFGASNVGETLERLPALNAAQDSRGERVLTLQGFTQRQVAVFVDGVPVLVPYDGQLDLSKFPIDMIARITVVKASAPVLYGPNGLGGAINLSTRDPHERPWIRARTELAAGAARKSLTGTARAANVGAVAGASLENRRFVPMSASFTPLPNEDGGRRDNSDRLAGSVAAKATIDLDETQRVIVTASRFEGTFGVPPATKDFSVRYWRWTDWYASSLGVGHEYRGRDVQTEALAYVSFVGNTLDGYDDARYATQRLPRALHSDYDDVSMGGFVRATVAPAAGPLRPELRAWAGIKRDAHASFDNTNPEKVHVSSNLLTIAALAQLDPVPRALRASAGVQLDGELPERPEGAQPAPRPDPSALLGPLGSLSWFASDALTVTASAALRSRFPTLRERFSTVFGTREPNPRLLPERALNLGLDAGYRPTRRLRIGAGVFDSEVRDLVTTVVVAPQTEQLENVGKARLAGVELQAEWSPARALELLAGALFLRARSGAELDAPVALVPSAKALGVVTVKPIDRVAISLIGRWIGPQDFPNPNTGVFERLDGHGLADARVEWRVLPSLRTYVRASNLFDANVEGRYSFPEAGRQAFVGLIGETP